MEALKFREMPYERPDGEALKTSMRTLTEKLRAAGSYEAAKAVFLEKETLSKQVDTEGRGYGNTFSIKPDMQQILIPVSALRPTKGVILPQEYPGGITPYYYPASIRDNDNVLLKWGNIDFVQISLRDEIYPVEQLKDKGIIIKKIQLVF